MFGFDFRQAQPDHSASLGDSTTLSTRIRFSVHTGSRSPLASLEDNGSPAIVSHYGGTPHPGDRGAGLGGSCVGASLLAFLPEPAGLGALGRLGLAQRYNVGRAVG